MFLLKIVFVILFTVSTCYADFRAMTMNTEWLWTPNDGKVDGLIKQNKDMSKTDYDEEVHFYRDLIQSHNIDLVALSEIENELVAQEMVAALGQGWRAFFKQGRDTATGQDVAIISRLPYIENSVTDFGFPAGFIPGGGKAKKITKIVGAQFWLGISNQENNTVGQKKLGVITAHLLSKRHENQQKANDRQKQALALRVAIDRFRAQVDVMIVLGDFNDLLASETLKSIKGRELFSYQECENFSKMRDSNEYKRWLRHIDHLLYSGVSCLAQYKKDLKPYSDHPAIYGEFSLPK